LVDKLGCNSAIVFVTNFLGIIPLGGILSSATEAISVHTGQVLGGLINATLGNVVEMIMCIQAVRAGLIRVVQGNLIGSVLSNLLLVLGMSITASGAVRNEQKFNTKGAAANMTCLMVAAISVCLPTVFKLYNASSEEEVIAVSRICSVFLLAAYFMYLTFIVSNAWKDEASSTDESGERGLSLFFSLVLLFSCTLCVFVCCQTLVGSIEDVSHTYGLPKAFIGVILLPIVGNAVEHATAVQCGHKGMMDLALGVAVGSSTQISLFVVPVACLYGWFVDQPMNLAFRYFDMLCMMLSVFLVSQILGHGSVVWLLGALLMCVYLIIATLCFYIRDSDA